MTNYQRTISYCIADFDSITWNIENHEFNEICWSNLNILSEQWYVGKKNIVLKHTPCRTKHRSIFFKCT